MPRLRLREDVFMARADGLLIFLDLAGDRYFALNNELSSRLQSTIDANGEGADEDIVRRLRQARAIAEPETSGRVFAPTQMQAPSRELTVGQAGCVGALSALACRWRAERSLHRVHLADIVRRRRQERLRQSERAPDDEELIRSASLF